MKYEEIIEEIRKKSNPVLSLEFLEDEKEQQEETLKWAKLMMLQYQGEEVQ